MSKSRQTQGTTNEKAYGEGNYPAARQYDREASDFAHSGKVDEAARRAEPEDAAQAADLEHAEQSGKARSRGEDQSVEHNQGKASTKPTDRTSPGRGPTNADSGESGRERREAQRGPMPAAEEE